MNISDFIRQINSYSAKAIPFFFLVDFEMNKPFVCRLDEAEAPEILYDFRGRKNFRSIPQRQSVHITSRTPVEFETYSSAFDKVMENLHSGNTYLLNLTFPAEIEIDADLETVFHSSEAPYRLMLRDNFVMFSPECFVRIENGIISGYPMKGTIDASIENAEQIILDDQKEYWEHNTIVDLIRNDLAIVSGNVEVRRFRFIDRIKTPEKVLLQVSSEIAGELGADWRSRLGDILVSMLPAGSISGAPKQKTVEIIGEAENGRRGYYTGISGIFDGENLDSAVNIRFIEKVQGRMLFRSGGGITANSSVESEYKELIDKINVPSSC